MPTDEDLTGAASGSTESGQGILGMEDDCKGDGDKQQSCDLVHAGKVTKSGPKSSSFRVEEIGFPATRRYV